MLYGSQKRFDKNGDGKLKGAEWQRWYQYAYGDEIEAEEKRKADRIRSKIETQLISAGGQLLKRGLMGILKK